ncbi:site-specific integrase [Micromonospora yasonensis]|uniref:tyrosine-type recombinase/integrase n=1 Tax=Micromonospora yasonensis TaxID=1128667 RepID=UPI00222F6A15|nr:site-specific integrase [Micromonospora yasonensis]MCW3844527.1 site-specific integrase [Micromonospora yasonensis]
MSADATTVAAAWQVLAHLGVTLTDLRSHTDGPAALPTIAEYLPRVIAAAGPGAQRTYGTYWQRMATAWGDRPLDAVAASDVEALKQQMTTTARSRRNSRNGRHAGEHVIAAARAFYSRAIADGLIDASASPAHRVAKPRRLPSTRRALTPKELEEINAVARTSGNDVILDALLLRLHTETACRRGGAIALRLVDLDRTNGLVRLIEKNGVVRWQPITLDLAEHLYEHAQARGAARPIDRLLRYRNGLPISSRRYDHLWKRIGERLPWVATQGISTHWLRHTTLTWVERNFGYGIARAYAGHTDSPGSSTTTYIKADLHDLADALSAMTGQPHPFANTSETSNGPATDTLP